MLSLTETPINPLITQAKTYYTNGQYQEALERFKLKPVQQNSYNLRLNY